jgi:hypothetical protein
MQIRGENAAVVFSNQLQTGKDVLFGLLIILTFNIGGGKRIVSIHFLLGIQTVRKSCQ